MAVTQSPTYNVSISFIDRDKNRSNISFHVPVGDTTVGALAADIEAGLIPALQAISDAQINGWSIALTASERALISPPAESSDVERKGVFSFRASDGSVYTCQVPSIKNTLVIDETNIVNRADPLVGAFIDAITDPAVLQLGKPSTYLGADLVNFEKARKMHRGSSRG